MEDRSASESVALQDAALPNTAESRRVMEAALRAAPILNSSQRDNVRRKAVDLESGRLAWDSVPFRVILETNRQCNLKCVMCDNTHNNHDVIEPRVVEKLFDEIGWGSMEIQPFASGEPTLAPMNLLAPLARKHNQYFNFITNGIRFTKDYYRAIADRVGRVQFSIHSHVPEISESIAPGQGFDRVVQNLCDALVIARHTGAHVIPGQCLMHRNFDGLVDYVRFMADLGVERVALSRLFPTSRIYPEEGIELHRSSAEIEDMTLRALEVGLDRGVHLESNLEPLVADPRNHPWTSSPFDVLQANAHIVELFRPGYCISTSITIQVEWDGTVLPCYRHRIVLGNIARQSFDEIWNGDVMQRHRASFVRQQLDPFCERCQEFFCNHA